MKNQVEVINDVIELYFQENPAVNIVPVKELMPTLIATGLFKKDIKKGKPLRDLLRKLNEAGELHLIPNIHTEEKESSTYWYAIRPGSPKPETGYKQEPVSEGRKEAERLRLLRDEAYVIDLCDTFLELKAHRQKRFDFLLGDLHSNGKTQTPLPVDAWYPDLNLVIEYMESQHIMADAFFDKPDKKTVSGVSREEQRRIYDARRAEVLPEHGIRLIAIPYDAFTHDKKHRIERNPDQDLKTVAKILKGIAKPKKSS